jgi:hypothetical protein
MPSRKGWPFSKLAVIDSTVILAITNLSSDDVNRRAREIAQRINREDGLKTALDWLELRLESAPVYRNL